MLGLVLLYFIGKNYYKLAEAFNKNKWLYAFIGIIFYYAGTIIGGVALAIILDLTEAIDIETMDETAMGFMAIPFGVLACWGGYKLFERNWTRKGVYSHSDLLDDDFIQ